MKESERAVGEDPLSCDSRHFDLALQTLQSPSRGTECPLQPEAGGSSHQTAAD